MFKCHMEKFSPEISSDDIHEKVAKFFSVSFILA